MAPPEARSGTAQAAPPVWEDEAVVAEYFLQSYLPIEDAAAALAGEQSTGTFVAVPGETQALRDRHAARVVGLEPVAPQKGAVLPGSLRPDRGTLSAARVRIAFPLRNFGPSIPNLMAAMLGNLFELRELASVKLLDVDLPAAFAERYPGPQFGVAGTRRLADVDGRPLFGTIVKPSIGMPAEELASLVRTLVHAGIDVIKDDELQGDPPHLPFEERVRVVMRELHTGAEATGRMAMYVFNVTGEIDEMRRRQEHVVAHGGTCVMVCMEIVGLPALAELRRESAVPIHAHRAMLGALMRSAGIGVEFGAYQKLARLCGADHVHTSGLGSKFYEEDDDIVRSVRAVLAPTDGIRPALPVLSSAQTPRAMPPTHARLNTNDLMVLAGGGILAHPDGAAAGLRAMHEAWAAGEAGESLAERAARSPELATALAAFGGGDG